MNEREYYRLKKQIEAQYESGLSALDTVWVLANPSIPIPGTPTKKRAQPRQESGDGSPKLRQIVAAVVDTLPPEFTTKEVDDALKVQFPSNMPERSTISHNLKRLEKAGAVYVITIGKGKRPTRYGRSGADATDEQAATIRALAQKVGFEPQDFFAKYLAPMGAEKLNQLSYRQANEMILDLVAQAPDAA